MGSRGCQDLVDCVGTGAMESCAKFAPACTEPLGLGTEKAKLQNDWRTEKDKLQNDWRALELHGSDAQGVYIGRHENATYVLRRTEHTKATVLIVPLSGAARVSEAAYHEDVGLWRVLTDDQMTDAKCGDLVTCLKEAADVRECAEATRTCMRYIPRSGMCERGETLELDGDQPATIPLLGCWVGGGRYIRHGSDESSFYIVSTKSVDGLHETPRSTLLAVPREPGAASTRGLKFKLGERFMTGVFSIEGTSTPAPTPASTPTPVPVATDPPCSETLGACIAGPDLSRCAERARAPCAVQNTSGGTLLYGGASIVLSRIGYDAYAADENNVYVVVSRLAELLVVPRRTAEKPTVVRLESVSESVWRVRGESRVLIWIVVACVCVFLLFLLWIATR